MAKELTKQSLLRGCSFKGKDGGMLLRFVPSKFANGHIELFDGDWDYFKTVISVSDKKIIVSGLADYNIPWRFENFVNAKEK